MDQRDDTLSERDIISGRDAPDHKVHIFKYILHAFT